MFLAATSLGNASPVMLRDGKGGCLMNPCKFTIPMPYSSSLMLECQCYNQGNCQYSQLSSFSRSRANVVLWEVSLCTALSSHNLCLFFVMLQYCSTQNSVTNVARATGQLFAPLVVHARMETFCRMIWADSSKSSCQVPMIRAYPLHLSFKDTVCIKQHFRISHFRRDSSGMLKFEFSHFAALAERIDLDLSLTFPLKAST